MVAAANTLTSAAEKDFYFERFKPLDYQRFVEVDISDVAIEKLRRYDDHRTSFLSTDGDVYEPGYFREMRRELTSKGSTPVQKIAAIVMQTTVVAESIFRSGCVVSSGGEIILAFIG